MKVVKSKYPQMKGYTKWTEVQGVIVKTKLNLSDIKPK